MHTAAKDVAIAQELFSALRITICHTSSPNKTVEATHRMRSTARDQNLTRDQRLGSSSKVTAMFAFTAGGLSNRLSSDAMAGHRLKSPKH
jgi:hypothetical protein